MSLRRVKPYNHEWLHFYGETSRNHYALSDAFSRYADRWGRWEVGQKYQPPVFKGSEVHYNPRLGLPPLEYPGKCKFDVSEIEARFLRVDWQGHNEYSSPAKKLGELAKLEESRLKMPGYGFFLMREVANGMPVKKAMAFVAQSPTIRRERMALLKAHPDLDWRK